jgi:Fur family transcriptional regulator, ferric uptake regulator
MTRAGITAAAGARDVATAVNALRARGLRLSAARRVLLEALYGAERPISAEEIAAGNDGRLPPSDLASVYRNLERLEELGLVRHVHLGHGPGRYLPTGSTWEFAVCEGCGEFVALRPDRLEATRRAVRDATGYDVRFTHFPLVGTCPSCDHPAPAAESQKRLVCTENYASDHAATAK